MDNIAFLVCSLAIICAAIRSDAVTYTVTNTAANTPGGTRFIRDVGVNYSRQTLQNATEFIWRVFRQTNASQRRNISRIRLFIDDIDGVAFARGDEIHVSARYIASYRGNVRREITGVLFHETTHIWQWNGNGRAPGGLIEGIADYVRLRAGYPPTNFPRPGQGNRWDEGYGVTARFLEYCERRRSGFVAELNRRMRDRYAERFFQDLLGRNVNQLWRDYKARPNN